MQLNIDAKAVEEAVVSAVVNSAIGQKINDAVKKMLDSYDNPLEGAIKRVVMDIALKIVQQEHFDEIKVAMKAKLTDEMMGKFIDRFWDEVMKNRY